MESIGRFGLSSILIIIGFFIDNKKKGDNKIGRPLLLLHGGSDSVVPIESQRIFYNKIKNMYDYRDRIEFIEYENLNHFVTTNMMEDSIIWFHRFLEA